MQPTSIFSKNLLDHYLPDFSLSSVVGIRETTTKILDLIKELHSTKIENSKEEEIKPRFITTFFGDVLGFNYGNEALWQLRDEKKTIVDATKADAVLGFFTTDKTKDDVRVVIEIKDANTELNKKQNRDGQQSPVDQAFSYAHKMGGKCKWVIVSNVKEIRFYSATDSSKYQLFHLEELSDIERLKELLYLFHKDRFIHLNDLSPTDKLLQKIASTPKNNEEPRNIIDRLYYSLKRFEGFGFVDPNYIATLSPFNILDDYVWHYHDEELFTINPEMYELIEGLTLENGKVILSADLQKKVEALNIAEAKNKLEWVLTFLNRCRILRITVIKDYQKIQEKNKDAIGFGIRQMFSFKKNEEGITKQIQLKSTTECDCLICNFRNFDFVRLIEKLKAADGNPDLDTPEYAYANYLMATNNFKSSYIIYKNIEKKIKGKEGKAVQYFLTRQNIKFLHNLVLDYNQQDSKAIMSDIKSVDLDKVIYDEIEFAVDKVVKQYLIDVKEETLINKIQDEMEGCLFEIDKLKKLYDGVGKQIHGPNMANQLVRQYFLLFSYVNGNFIVNDVFKKYRAISEKFFSGLVILHNIPGLYEITFDDFILTEAILHLDPNSLRDVLKSADNLKTKDKTTEKMLLKLKSFTTSIYKNGLLADAYENPLLIQQLHNFRFQDKFTNIFANLFTVLSHLDITPEQFSENGESLIKFLKIEKILGWFDIEKLSDFIYEKGSLFSENQLLEILTIAVNDHRYGRNKCVSLLQSIPRSLSKFYPNYKIANAKLIRTVLVNSCSEDGKNKSYMDLISLVDACDPACRKIMFSDFEEYLDAEFAPDFYQELILNSEYDCHAKNYFQLYLEYVSHHKGAGYKFGKLKLTDLIFINFIIAVNKRGIDISKIKSNSFTNLNDFERWLLDPLSFDYNKFDAKWLTEGNIPFILEKIRGHKEISLKIDRYLRVHFDPKIAELKYQYFN